MYMRLAFKPKGSVPNTIETLAEITTPRSCSPDNPTSPAAPAGQQWPTPISGENCFSA